MSLFYKRLISLSFFFILLPGCSIYKSTGRENFEDRAPDKINSATVAATESRIQDESDLCWNQSAKDPIWNLDQIYADGQDHQLIVRRLQDSEIQICVQAEPKEITEPSEEL